MRDQKKEKLSDPEKGGLNLSQQNLLIGISDESQTSHKMRLNFLKGGINNTMIASPNFNYRYYGGNNRQSLSFCLLCQ